MASAEGEKMLEAIGPASATAAEAIQAITLCPWNEIEQLQIALYPVDTGPAQAVFVVRLAASVKADEWLERLPARDPAEEADKHYFRAGGREYYLPEAEAGRLIVIASAAENEHKSDHKWHSCSNALRG